MKKCAICGTSIEDSIVGLKCKPCKNAIAEGYRQQNRTEINRRAAEYRERNRDKIRLSQAEYVKRNHEKIVDSQRKYTLDSVEKRRQYRIENSEKLSKKTAEYRAKNIVRLRKQDIEKKKTKYREDGRYRISHNLRSRISLLLKRADAKKSGSTYDLVGCSRDELATHLESLFKPGMTWENKGRKGWHIDHIIPCAAFDLSDYEQQKKCFHYTNLQPLWWYENLSKGAKLV